MRTDGSEWMVAVWGTQRQCSYHLRKRESKGQESGDGKWSCQEIKWWQTCQDVKRHTWNSLIPIFANLQRIYSANDILLYILVVKTPLFFPALFSLPHYGIKMLSSEEARWGAVAWLFNPVWKPRSACGHTTILAKTTNWFLTTQSG